MSARVSGAGDDAGDDDGGYTAGDELLAIRVVCCNVLVVNVVVVVVGSAKGGRAFASAERERAPEETPNTCTSACAAPALCSA